MYMEGPTKGMCNYTPHALPYHMAGVTAGIMVVVAIGVWPFGGPSLLKGI
jgi:hypothetical protein